jgi:hypothetical protein
MNLIGMKLITDGNHRCCASISIFSVIDFSYVGYSYVNFGNLGVGRDLI